MWYCLIAFLSAFAASALLAPLIARLAIRYDVVDRPDGHRKLHRRAVPLTGGPTLLLSGITGVLITLGFFPDLLAATAHDIKFLTALSASGLLIVVLGIVDDRFGMRGRQKLAGQIVAAMIMVPSGIVIKDASFFGYAVSFGDFGPIITLIAIVGAINALNLIDGVDGLASTTGIVLALSIAAITLDS